MRCNALFSSFSKRMSNSRHLLMLALVGIGLCVIHYLSANFRVNYILYAVTLVFPFAVLGLAPLPWQWTGDDQPKARPFRGLVQAMVINGLWMGLLVFCVWAWGPDAAPPDKIMARQVLIARLGLGVFTWVATIGFGLALSAKEATEARERETARLLRQSQSKALRSQLEPHVLYNALNGLSELIREDPLAAEEVVVRLAQLYRMLTHQGNSDRISLEEERQLVEAYLAMEHMRLGDRLETQWMWAQGDDHVKIPPLFLQPLVENAIKHGVSPSDQGGKVVISYDRQGQEHILQVANTGRPPHTSSPHGIGLGNLEARLALWTEAKGSLEFTRQGDWTYATVRWTPNGVA